MPIRDGGTRVFEVCPSLIKVFLCQGAFAEDMGYGPWVFGQGRTDEGFNWDKSVIMICLWI